MFGIGPIELFVVAIMSLAFYFVWIPVGAYVAKQKRRNVMEGALLGLLGPFGAVIEALLPTNPVP